MAFEVFGSYRGEAMVAGDALEVYDDGVVNPAPKLRKPRNDKGVPRGPRKVAPKVVAKTAPKGSKRGPGRPRVYNGQVRRIVGSFLKKYGLTKGIEKLATERKIKVSLTLARSVAEQYGIEFKLGRPAA